MSKKTEQRRLQIRKLVVTNGSMKVSQLADTFHVTRETIRTDLRDLEAHGLIVRSHGSAERTTLSGEVPIEYRQIQQADIKKIMARSVIELIPNHSLIYMDASTSVLEAGRLLPLKRDLTIYTNSLVLTSVLKDTSHKVYLLGGRYFAQGERTVGSQTQEAVKDIYFDVCLLGADAVNLHNGVLTGSLEEKELLKTVVHHSALRILTADASKTKHAASYQYAEQSDFDYFVTTKLDADIYAQLKFQHMIETMKE